MTDRNYPDYIYYFDGDLAQHLGDGYYRPACTKHTSKFLHIDELDDSDYLALNVANNWTPERYTEKETKTMTNYIDDKVIMFFAENEGLVASTQEGYLPLEEIAPGSPFYDVIKRIHAIVPELNQIEQEAYRIIDEIG